MEIERCDMATCGEPARASIWTADGPMPLCEQHVLRAIDRGKTLVVNPPGFPNHGLGRVREAVARARGDLACPTAPIVWAGEAPTDAQEGSA